jgi:hypothetical protein
VSFRYAVADAAAIVLFTTVGLLSHGFELVGYVRDALPILGAWFGVAFALGLYRRRSWPRFAACWAIAIPLGVLVRALALGRDLDGGQAAFLGVALGIGLVFLVALRLLAAALPVRA